MKFKKRALSVLLSAAMICNVGLAPVLAYAATGDTPIVASTLCEHHPAHTADCGYTEGTPCTYECLICNPKDTLPPVPMGANAVAAKAAKGANAITIKINDVATEYGGATLEAAVTASSATASTIIKLTVTGGEVTAADWAYLAGGNPGNTTSTFTALTDFTVDAVVTAVADIPVGATSNPIFPQSIVSVTIPQVTAIGSNAFSGCTALTTATFPKVAVINDFAFIGCSALAELKVSAIPPTVGAGAFASCPPTRSLVLVDANGTPLADATLTTAQTTYDAVATDGGTAIDGLWYGWKVRDAVAPPVVVGAFTVTGGAKDTDYSYANKTLTINSGTALTISTTTPTITDKIMVADGANANVTLDGTDIRFNDGDYLHDGTCAFEIIGNANCNLTLKGDNTLKSGGRKAGLQVQTKNGKTASLVITKGSTGSLNATGGSNGAGIGGGSRDAGGTITINEGTVTATSGDDGAGIGGGYNGGAGTFSTGTTGSAFINASSIAHQGNKANWKGVVFEGNNGKLYGTNISLSQNATVPAGKTLRIFSGETLTIPANVTLKNNGTIVNLGTIVGNVAGTQATVPATTIPQSFSVADGTIAVMKDGNDKILIQQGQNYYSGVKTTPLTFTGTTTANKIVVQDGATSNITLDNVSIDVNTIDYACAFEISGNAICNLTLIGNNTLKSGNYRAGLQVPAGATLTIGGTGALNASTTNYGAGIGGAENGASGTITINSGTVTATGKNDCAGIGSGGYGAACGTITINGGVVKATGGSITAIGDGNGAGIGGGTNGSGGIITINGGTVTATGGGIGAGIGGGGDGGAGGEITISGGVVTAIGGNLAAGIGGGYRGEGGTISINGGTVTATGGSISATWGDGNGAGIGGGSDSAGGTITISGGTVKATGGTTIGTSMQPVIGMGIGGGNNGTAGTFSTGTSGNAFIDSTGISDQNSKTNWNGVIFENNTGKVYGAPVTLTTNVEIPSGKTLKVEKGETIIVGTGVTLTNNGTITNNGIINNSGTINGGGTVGGAGTITTVTAVTVSPANVRIEIGEKQQLTATVIGTNNPAQTVTWASSDPAVATVSASGLVTAVANGTATITATSAINTSKKGAVAVTVAPPTPIAPPVQPNGNTNVIDHENNFWISVVSLIQSTKKGDVLKIDTGAYTQMPACVMEEIRIKGAGMIIKWNGGKNIVIPIGKALCAEKNRDVWALAELAKMYNKYSLGNKTNPTTGVDTYEIVDTQTGATTPIIGNIVDTTATQGGQTGKYILVVLAGTLVAAVAVFGVCIWTRKKEKEENEE